MPTASTVTLENDDLLLTLAPRLGASVTRLEFKDDRERLPVLIGGQHPDTSVEDSACFPMVPFANRARGNTIGSGECEFRLKPNTDEPLALHGVAWQLPWEIVDASPTSCLLELEVEGAFVYRFKLAYRIALVGSSAAFELRLTNTDDHPIPVGLGFHPYFPRYDDTRIEFSAADFWPEGSGHLPVGRTRVPAASDFSCPRRIPALWINDCYSGWGGSARVIQPRLGYSLCLEASLLDCLMFYADPELSRFALEPQSHAPGETGFSENGMFKLNSRAARRAAMQLIVIPH